MNRAIPAAVALSAFFPLSASEPAPKAVLIARSVIQAMGGEAAWKDARFVRFDFIVKTNGIARIERKHLWDKQTGRYRMEEKSANESPGVVLLNLRTRQGAVYVDGKKEAGPDALRDLKGVSRTVRMDLDWLALPWRWLQPGYHLKYAGEKTLQGQLCDVLEVTVDQPDATLATRYTAYVSRRSHLLEHWSVGAEPSLWDWQYMKIGGIQLASNHVNIAKRAEVDMGAVKVLNNVDQGFLTDPAKRLLSLK